MKLLPQYSIRLMLGITTLVAGMFSMVALAMRGHGWAIGISAALAAAAVAMAIYAAFFGVLWAFAIVSDSRVNRRVGRPSVFGGTASPFAGRAVGPAVEAAVDAVLVDEPEPPPQTSDSPVGGDGGS